MRKQIIGLLTLFVALALFITACGGEAAQPAQEEPQPASGAADNQAPAAEGAVVEACTDPLGCVTVAPGEPIRIASALVIAGSNGTLGVDSQTGVEVAIKQRGELVGHPVELQAEDDGCSAEGGQTT